MWPSRTGERSLYYSIVLLAAALPMVAAQTLPKAPARIPRTLILPATLVGGAPSTLAVLDAAGRLMPEVVVELSGRPSVTTDATGRALFMAPPGPGVLVAWTKGRTVTATSTIEPANPATSGTPMENSAPDVSIASYPQFLSPQDRFAVIGSGFRGEADANHVFLADQPCLVLAASPVALVILPGAHIFIGAAVLRINVAGARGGNQPPAGLAVGQAEAAKPVSVVALEVSGPVQNVHAGAQGMLTIRARGTAERVQVELRNGSPTIVQLGAGNVQRIVTSGGDQNIAQVEMKFLASGDYTIVARLIPDAAATRSSGT